MKIISLFQICSNNIFKYGKEIWLPITIKLIIFPIFIFLACHLLNTQNFIKAFILQAACPTAISVLLISEAKKDNRDSSSIFLVTFSTIIFNDNTYLVFFIINFS